ncbi:MAG: DUF2065 domain-containing protein [Devosia sp.]|nr:DUF2065 domain-containing protein [Devosia sp.]
MIELLSAFCLAIVIEGLAYAAFPEQMKKVLASIQAMPASTIRAVALACAAIALVLLWFIRG